MLYSAAIAISLFMQSPVDSMKKWIPAGELAIRSTAFVIGPSSKEPGSQSFGTGFFVGMPIPDQPGRFYPVLATADHVFRDISGDFATLSLRKAQGTNWTQYETKIQIRDGATEKWTKHCNADVAAIRVHFTVDCMFQLDDLITDAEIKALSLAAGSEVMTVGYPLGARGPHGFALLKSGTISSYPLVPTKDFPIFQADFHGWPGNSGGCVYFWANTPIVNGATPIYPEGIFKVIGVFVQSTMRTSDNVPIGLGGIVHASLLKEVIESIDFKKPEYRFKLSP